MQNNSVPEAKEPATEELADNDSKVFEHHEELVALRVFQLVDLGKQDAQACLLLFLWRNRARCLSYWVVLSVNVAVLLVTVPGEVRLVQSCHVGCRLSLRVGVLLRQRDALPGLVGHRLGL